MEYNRTGRIRIIFSFMLLGAVILVVRLFFVQIVRGGYYTQRADRQYQLPSGALPERGSIFFATKDNQLVSAATMQDGFSLAISPKLIINASSTFAALSPVIDLDPNQFFEKASKSNDPYEQLVDRLDQKSADKIAALKLAGVSVYKSRWRTYPAGSLAAQTIGFMGYSGDTLTGQYGLERQYDTMLTRDPDKNFINFIADAFSEIDSTVNGSETTKRDEADLVTTIEPTVQQTLEQELTATEARYAADSIGGIIMDPITGEIRALASRPTFDPNGPISSLAVLRNPIVENVYEMGSIVKALTMAAGLDAGVVTPTTTYNDTGSLVLNGKRISNYDGRGRGVIPMQQVLNQSLNTGAVFVMEQLGQAKFRQYFTDYGLGEKTGVDLPDEAEGLITNLQSSRDVEYATAAFGQGIAVSPIEITRALASLANGGLLVEPRVVKKFERVNTKLSTVIQPQIQRRVLKPETSKTITQMLVKVVDQALANGKVKMTRYSIAAKTGTAQIPMPGGGYYPDRYLHSFFGYFPAYEPRFIVFLYIVYPKNVQYASETLTQPFINLTKFLLNYYNVPPDR